MEPRTKAVFVDRDGTLNYDNGYTHKISDLKIYEDMVPLLKGYYDRGYIIIVITNQSGINRGYYSVEETETWRIMLEINHAMNITMRAFKLLFGLETTFPV